MEKRSREIKGFKTKNFSTPRGIYVSLTKLWSQEVNWDNAYYFLSGINKLRKEETIQKIKKRYATIFQFITTVWENVQ